jgi:hypothetical protein
MAVVMTMASTLVDWEDDQAVNPFTDQRSDVLRLSSDLISGVADEHMVFAAGQFIAGAHDDVIQPAASGSQSADKTYVKGT